MFKKQDFVAIISNLFHLLSQRKNLVKNTPKIMPFVIEMFDMEKYPHVDALLANCQGVFLNSVRPRLLGGVQGYLFIYLISYGQLPSFSHFISFFIL